MNELLKNIIVCCALSTSKMLIRGMKIMTEEYQQRGVIRNSDSSIDLQHDHHDE